jgi:hypothetical protein
MLARQHEYARKSAPRELDRDLLLLALSPGHGAPLLVDPMIDANAEATPMPR